MRGPAIKYKGLIWLLVDDDAMRARVAGAQRDSLVGRQVLAFDREIERLAGMQSMHKG